MKILEDTDACLRVSCEDRFGFRCCEGELERPGTGGFDCGNLNTRE